MTLSAIVVVALLAAAGCKAPRAEDESERAPTRMDERGRIALSAKDRKAVDLQTTVAAQGVLTTRRVRYGKVVARPQEDSLLVAPVVGRLTSPPVSLGAQVKAADLLAVLEPLVDTASRASIEAQRRELLGQVEGARAQIVAKKSELDRVSALVAARLATEADQARAQAELTTEQARFESLERAASELGRLTGGRLELRAPVPGVVATLLTDTGALVQQGTVLVRVVRSGPRWVDLAVPPGDPVGSGYQVRGIPDAVPAQLLSRGTVVQPDGTRRDRLEAGPEAAASLPPGATLPVDVLHEATGILVPAEAVLRRGKDKLVFVEVEAGRFEARTIGVAERDDATVLVSSGIKAGEHVVTRGAGALLGELGAGRQDEKPEGAE